MTKRRGLTGTTSLSTATPPAIDAAAVPPLSQEKTPEQKAAIAAVTQAPPGAAEPFAVAAPADVLKNVMATELVAEAAAAGDPLALEAAAAAAPAARAVVSEDVSNEQRIAAATIGSAVSDGAFDSAERVIGAPDVADQLGGPIPRAPAVAAAAEHVHGLASIADVETAVNSRLDVDGSLSGWPPAQSAEFDPLGDLAGRTFMVRSASDRGRRRAGRAFGPTAVAVDVDDLTPEELGALLSDRQLFAELLPVDLSR